MTCPKCSSKRHFVVDSRHPDVESMWRLRRCRDCGQEWETMETETEHVEKIKRGDARRGNHRD